MTREDAIEILRKNRPTSDPRPCGMELCDALDMAISAIRQQEHFREVTKKVEPLTLDELREMDGEPVWVHTFSAIKKKTNVAQWAILETVGSANATFLRAGVNSRLTKWFCNYGNTWLAYRQKPEEESHQ